MSLARIAPGLCNPAKDAPLRGGWTRQQSAKWHYHNRRETSETTLTSFTSPLLISSHPLTPVVPKSGAAPPIFRPGPTLQPLTASLSSSSSTSSSSVPLFFPPKCSSHFDTAEVLAVEADLWGTILLSTCISPRSPPAPQLPNRR